MLVRGLVLFIQMQLCSITASRNRGGVGTEFLLWEAHQKTQSRQPAWINDIFPCPEQEKSGQEL